MKSKVGGKEIPARSGTHSEPPPPSMKLGLDLPGGVRGVRGGMGSPPLFWGSERPLCACPHPQGVTYLWDRLSRWGGRQRWQPPAWGQGGGTFPNRGRRGAVMLEGRGKKETENGQKVLF